MSWHLSGPLRCRCAAVRRWFACGGSNFTNPGEVLRNLPAEEPPHAQASLRHCALTEVCSLLFSHVLLLAWSMVHKAKADNTVRENKNNTHLKFLSWLGLQRGLETTALFLHRVGHTHGPLGALAVFSMFPLKRCLHWDVAHRTVPLLLRSDIWGAISIHAPHQRVGRPARRGGASRHDLQRFL